MAIGSVLGQSAPSGWKAIYRMELNNTTTTWSNTSGLAMGSEFALAQITTLPSANITIEPPTNNTELSSYPIVLTQCLLSNISCDIQYSSSMDTTTTTNFQLYIGSVNSTYYGTQVICAKYLIAGTAGSRKTLSLTGWNTNVTWGTEWHLATFSTENGTTVAFESPWYSNGRGTTKVYKPWPDIIYGGSGQGSTFTLYSLSLTCSGTITSYAPNFN